MIKLIVSDMDGTLLNSKGELDPSFFHTYEKLKQHNIRFVVASGRQYYNLVEKFDSIKDELIFIAENGTWVVEKEKPLLIEPLNTSIAHKLIKLGRSIASVEAVVCTTECAYVESDQEDLLEEIPKYYERYKVVEDLLEIKEPILKVTFCDFAGAEKNSYKVIKPFEKTLHICLAGTHWVDMMAKDTSKGRAVRLLQEKWGITKEETMVFGDYPNDLEMMDEAYYSYAMENAHESLKKRARFIARSNNDKGVIYQIEQYLSTIENS